MQLLENLDGIFIDFYGTIAGGDRAVVERTSGRVAADLNLSLSAAELASQWGRVFFGYLDRHNGDAFHSLTGIERLSLVETVAPMVGTIDPNPYVDELTAYWRRPPLHPEAAEALRALPVPLCCVSNVDTADLLAACEHHGLAFDHIITSEDTRSYKPDNHIFNVALERTGWRPECVIHVGDSLHSDVMGAHRAGLRAVWIRREDRILDIGQADPEWTISDLRGLLTLENH